jgi:hypothetical protein
VCHFSALSLALSHLLFSDISTLILSHTHTHTLTHTHTHTTSKTYEDVIWPMLVGFALCGLLTTFPLMLYLREKVKWNAAVAGEGGSVSVPVH